MKTSKAILSIQFFISIFLVNSSVYSQDQYVTRPLQPNINSLQITVNNTWGALPILQLGSSDYLVVNFDRVNTSVPERFRYKLVHCNSDWTPSGLLDVEYIDGFNDNLIDDYSNSQATTVDYVNYQIQIPNDNISMKLSGNYALVVYEEDNPANIVLTACFYVVENQASVSSTITSNTDEGANREFQQLSFTINPQNLKINDPYVDIKPVVMQNRRRDNMRFDLKPTFLNSGQLLFEHNPKLIFDAGNEYRRFEFVSTKSGGMNVDRFRYEDHKHNAWVIPDRIRAGKSYVYDQDQDGRFYIRNYDGTDSNVDADYAWIHFNLISNSQLPWPVYLFGDFTYGMFNDQYEMKYNESEKEYELSVLLKLGAYNYMYLTQNDGAGSTKLIEGNYYQAENEYLTLVYYKPIGQRYDRLVGYSSVK